MFKVIMFISFLLISQNSFAQNIELNELEKIAVKISKDGIRLLFDDDRVAKIYYFQKELVIESDEELGQIFIYPKDNKAINITLISENKRVQDLKLIPDTKGVSVINLVSKPNSEIIDIESIFEAKKDLRIKSDIKNIIKGDLKRFSIIPKNPGTNKRIIKKLQKQDTLYIVYELDKFTDMYEFMKSYKAYAYFENSNKFYLIVVS